jgi:hypothetical protein
MAPCMQCESFYLGVEIAQFNCLTHAFEFENDQPTPQFWILIGIYPLIWI